MTHVVHVFIKTGLCAIKVQHSHIFYPGRSCINLEFDTTLIRNTLAICTLMFNLNGLNISGQRYLVSFTTMTANIRHILSIMWILIGYYIAVYVAVNPYIYQAYYIDIITRFDLHFQSNVMLVGAKTFVHAFFSPTLYARRSEDFRPCIFQSNIMLVGAKTFAPVRFSECAAQ